MTISQGLNSICGFKVFSKDVPDCGDNEGYSLLKEPKSQCDGICQKSQGPCLSYDGTSPDVSYCTDSGSWVPCGRLGTFQQVSAKDDSFDAFVVLVDYCYPPVMV